MQSTTIVPNEHRFPDVKILKIGGAVAQAANDWTTAELHTRLQLVYATVLKFCWYESNGLIAELYDLTLPPLEVPQAYFQKESRELNWHLLNSQDLQRLGEIEYLLDTESIVAPLRDVADNFDEKLFWLTVLFHHAYKEYRITTHLLQRLDHSKSQLNLPEITKAAHLTMAEKLHQHSLYLKKYGIEPRTLEWQRSADFYTNSQKEMTFVTRHMKKYFHEPYFCGSELYELETAVCFMQETIVYVAKYQLDLDLIAGSSIDYPQRWKKYVDVRLRITSKPENENDRFLAFTCDDNAPHVKARQIKIIQKVIQYEYFKALFSAEFVAQEADAPDYFRNLFSETERMFNYLLKKEHYVYDIPDAPDIITNDFVAEYLHHDLVKKAWLATNRNQAKRKILLNDICFDAAYLQHIDNTLSKQVSQVLRLDVRIAEAYLKCLKKWKKRDSIAFYNTDKLRRELNYLTDPIHKIKLLANVYISTATFIYRTLSGDKLYFDKVNYPELRKSLESSLKPAQPAKKQRASRPKRPDGFVSRNPDLDELKALHQRTQLDELDALLKTTTESCEQLQRQVTLAMASPANIQADAQQSTIVNLQKRLQKLINVTSELHTTLEDMKPDDATKLAKNQKVMRNAQELIGTTLSKNTILLKDIHTVALTFEPVIPLASVQDAWTAHAARQRQKEQTIADDINTLAAGKSQLKVVQDSLEPQILALQELQLQYKQMLTRDDEERRHDLRPHRLVIEALDSRHYEIEQTCKTVKTQLDTIICTNDDELTVSQRKTLVRLLAKISMQRTQQELLLADIQKAALVLDHIIPKSSFKKADEAFLQAQLKKEKQLAREEEIRASRAKREKIVRPKPSARPLTLTSTAATLASVKPDYKSAKPDPKAGLRLLHLNESCKNLILIKKILTVYQSKLTSAEMHYALLYNIFRCFQSLRMYHACGGQQRSIAADDVTNLRHMIMHHGASVTQAQEVITFAEEIVTTLPPQLLKLSHRALARETLSAAQRQELMIACDLVEPGARYSPCLDHSRIVLNATPLYQKLAAFHAGKITNDDDPAVSDAVLGTYIPLIQEILTPLKKATGPDSETKPEHFLDTFYLHLQALRMLASMCGEFAGQVKKVYPANASLQAFLKFCHYSVRNMMGHETQDFQAPELFFQHLKRYIDDMQVKDQQPASTINTGNFFRQNIATPTIKNCDEHKTITVKRR